MNRRWLVNKTNPEYLSYISKTASVSPVLAQILINRGLKTATEIREFLSPGISGLSDPFDLPDMLSALKRIKAALDRGEKVLVHGDYDTDGLTATAIMVHSLKRIGLDVSYFIPNRMKHGYGFSLVGVEAAKKRGASLIITVDCGITSFEAAASARSSGIDVIITDHHEPVKSNKGQVTSKAVKENKEVTGDSLLVTGFQLPEAVAVINPKLGASGAHLSILSGAGIAFKVAQAFMLDPDLCFSEGDFFPLLDLAALGTIADVVPLVGENRIMIKEAMSYIHDGNRCGIHALKQAAGLDGRQIKSGLLSFTIVPRINAAGRIADSADVVRLLLSEDEDEAAGLCSWVNDLNIKRQRIEEAVYRDALSRLESMEKDSAILLAGEGWHEGVVGIVASRIAETYNLPVCVLSIDNGIAKGSARSIPSFDICRGFAECSDLLLSFGGHRQAAGIRLKAENLPAFEKRFKQIVRQQLTEEDMIPSLEIDANINISELNYNLVKEIEMLEPFGYANPEPLLGAKDLEVISPRLVGNNHLKMRLKKGSTSLDAIGFDMGDIMDDLHIATTVDAVFTPAINEWNGNRYLQLVLKAFRPSIQ